MSFSADPAGQRDSRQAITAAITRAAESGGGTLYFPAGTYRISPHPRGIEIDSPDIVLRGAGTSATTLFFEAPRSRLRKDFGNGLYFRAAGGGVADMRILGDKENFDDEWPNGQGYAGIMIRGERCHVRHVHVAEWPGSGVRIEGRKAASPLADIVITDCQALDCGRPRHRPGVEHGDGFTSACADVTFTRCRTVDSQTGQPRDKKCMRGGFVHASHEGRAIIRDCQSIGPHRSIHLEPIPWRATIEGFYGTDARNGIILFAGDKNRESHVDGRDLVFEGCGRKPADGAIHTGVAHGLNLDLSRVRTVKSRGADSYLHKQGKAPSLVRLTDFDFDANVRSAAGLVDQIDLRDGIVRGRVSISRISRVAAENVQFLNTITGRDAAPKAADRGYRFVQCRFVGDGERPVGGRGNLTLNIPLVVFDRCAFVLGGRHDLPFLQLAGDANVDVLDSLFDARDTLPTIALDVRDAVLLRMNGGSRWAGRTNHPFRYATAGSARVIFDATR
ncbi:MAG: glycosyl hydrolase family 28-related protein [Alphaproteobacteria bacterium]